MGHRGCSRLGSGSWPICQDRMWGRTGDTMWGSEKGTAGTGTSRRHKWAHRTAPTPQVPCAPPALRVLLHLPGPGGPACSGLSAGGRDAKELVGPGRCRVGAGSAQPTQVWPRRLRQQSSAPGWPRLAGWQEPPAPLAARGGRAHPVITPQQLPALPGQGGDGRAGTARWGGGRCEAIAHPRLVLACCGEGKRGAIVPPSLRGTLWGHPRAPSVPPTRGGGSRGQAQQLLWTCPAGPQRTMTPLRSCRAEGGDTQGGGGRSDSNVTPGLNPAIYTRRRGGL